MTERDKFTRSILIYFENSARWRESNAELYPHQAAFHLKMAKELRAFRDSFSLSDSDFELIEQFGLTRRQLMLLANKTNRDFGHHIFPKSASDYIEYLAINAEDAAIAKQQRAQAIATQNGGTN